MYLPTLAETFFYLREHLAGTDYQIYDIARRLAHTRARTAADIYKHFGDVLDQATGDSRAYARILDVLLKSLNPNPVYLCTHTYEAGQHQLAGVQPVHCRQAAEDYLDWLLFYEKQTGAYVHRVRGLLSVRDGNRNYSIYVESVNPLI